MDSKNQRYEGSTYKTTTATEAAAEYAKEGKAQKAGRRSDEGRWEWVAGPEPTVEYSKDGKVVRAGLRDDGQWVRLDGTLMSPEERAVEARAERLIAFFPGNSEIASLFNQLIDKVGKLVG